MLECEQETFVEEIMTDKSVEKSRLPGIAGVALTISILYGGAYVGLMYLRGHAPSMFIAGSLCVWAFLIVLVVMASGALGRRADET